MDPLDVRILPKAYNKMLADYFAQLCEEMDSKIQRPATEEEVQRWMKEIRLKLREAMMIVSEEYELNAKTLDKIKKKGYVIENIVIESRPNFFVPGNLYIPERGDVCPAILHVHGHYSDGRFEPHVQAMAVTLARAGFAVLTIDTIGYGDRAFQGHGEGVWLPAVSMSLPGLILWDNMRAIDYLLSREEVDSKRIGVTGSSGGGNQTMYLAALDSRIAAAAPVVSAEVFEEQVASGRCYCECVPGIMRFANVSDVLALIAPRPLMIVSGVHDTVFPVLRARKAYMRVRRVYELLGAEDKVKYVEVHAGHGYTYDMRRAVYRFFNRYLRGVEEDLEECELELELQPFSPLSCQVNMGETITSLYYRRAKQLEKLRARKIEEWLHEVPKLKRSLVENVFGGFPEEHLEVTRLGKLRYGDLIAEKLVLETERGIYVPALLIEGRNGGLECCVYLPRRGLKSVLVSSLTRRKLDEGVSILAIEFRGIGETLFNEEIAVKNSLVLGRHILGMRIYDTLRSLDLLVEEGFERVSVIGEGVIAAVVALFSAALDDRISGVQVIGIPSTLVSKNGFKYPPSLFPPRLLNYADIPEVAALVAPRSLQIEHPVDPHLKPLSQEKAEEIFAFTRAVYEYMGAPWKFTIKAV